MMRTLFLQAPTFDGFDGGAGSRYQAKREIKSFWYRPGSPSGRPGPELQADRRAAARHQAAGDRGQANDFDLVVLHTSVPSFKSDVKTIEALKAANPKLIAGLIGAKVAVDAAGAMARRPRSISAPATSSTSPSRRSLTACRWRRSRVSPIAMPTVSWSTTRTARS